MCRQSEAGHHLGRPAGARQDVFVQQAHVLPQLVSLPCVKPCEGLCEWTSQLHRCQKLSKQKHRHMDCQKLVIILVGLLGRGKTFLCNKLM